MGEVFCDDLRVTVPASHWPDVRGSVQPVLESIGAAVEYQSEERIGWRYEGGTAQAKRVGVVWSLSTSGQMLAGLRLRSLFGQFLAAIGSSPHKVTGLHATMDREAATPPVLEELLAKVASDDGLRLSRKRVALSHVDRWLVRRADGSDTGTMYLGSKAAEVRACVYDKREERIAHGMPDLGYDLTRYELRLRGVGASLRDASEPTSIFWHYMAPDVLPCPVGVAPWVSHAQGVELDWPPVAEPAERLAQRVFRSDDLASILKLARSFPGGPELLLSMLRRRMLDPAAESSALN